jgi:hypothetical protein
MDPRPGLRYPRFMTTVKHSGRRLSGVALATGAITLAVAASLWLLGSSISQSALQMEGRLFGNAGQEKEYGVGSLRTLEEPARLSSKTLEVIAAPRTHFRTATDLSILTVELYRGTLLTRGEVSLVIGEATANGNGAFILTTESGQAIEQLNASLEKLSHGKPLDTKVSASGAPQTLFVLSGQIELRIANQTPQYLIGGQTWPRPR